MPRSSAAAKGYDIGNLRLLFQAPTANVNTQPTIQVSFDGTRAAAGDVIRLMEGGQVLASRTLSDADLGSSNVTLSLTPASSLGAGQHTLSSKYIDVAGNTVTGNDIVFNVQGGATAPVLSNLKVSGDGQAAQAINDSTTRYAMVSAAAGDSTGSSGLQHQLSFTGTVGTAGSGHSYLVTVSMGGKLLAFNQFAAGDFKLEAPANVLAPGFYKDLSIVATDVTDGPSNGQSTAIGGQTLGWYWAPQSLTNLTAGAGDDMIPLGAAATANGIYNTEVQTGAGKDTLVVGASGATDSARLMARVSDFMVGMDKVSVAGQTVTAANLDRFVTASAAPANGTILSIDLDGPGPGSLTYTLLLVNVQYAQSNTALRKIPIESIKDVRSLGIDLLLVFSSGGQILLREGALEALVHPQRRLQFSDGVLTLQQIFTQSERFDFFNNDSSAPDGPGAAAQHLAALAASPEASVMASYPFGV